MPPEEDRYTAIGNTHKNFDKDRPCRSEDTTVSRQTQRQTDTLITILIFPVRGGVAKLQMFGAGRGEATSVRVANKPTRHA